MRGSIKIKCIENQGFPQNQSIYFNDKRTTLAKSAVFFKFQVSPLVADKFLWLLNSNPAYRQLTCCHLAVSSDVTLQLTVRGNHVESIDKKGAEMVQNLVMKAAELEDALHWLSTLGGAYSNLGDHDREFAKKAGKNAMKQLAIASRSGDENIVMRGWLFVGQSLIQQGDLSRAALIIRAVWQNCNSGNMASLHSTEKLVNMCLGIWARLKHEKKKSLIKKQSQIADQIEVEQKFSVPENYVEKLTEAGGKKIGSKQFTDVYKDTEDFILIKRDVWLRKRDENWELKLGNRSRKSATTVYREISDMNEVRKKVEEMTGISDPKNLTTLVEFSTERETWSLGELNVVVDVLKPKNAEDQNVYKVGEIEKLISCEDDLEHAHNQVQSLAASLGFNAQVGGKVSHCLRTQNPAALKMLQEIRSADNH